MNTFGTFLVGVKRIIKQSGLSFNEIWMLDVILNGKYGGYLSFIQFCLRMELNALEFSL